MDDVQDELKNLLFGDEDTRRAGNSTLKVSNCEAQGKGRAKVRPRKVTQRSFMDGGWWMVDILSLMLYTKFGCHPPTHRKSLNLQD